MLFPARLIKKINKFPEQDIKKQPENLESQLTLLAGADRYNISCSTAVNIQQMEDKMMQPINQRYMML